MVDLRFVNDNKTRLKPMSTFLHKCRGSDRYRHGGDLAALSCIGMASPLGTSRCDAGSSQSAGRLWPQMDSDRVGLVLREDSSQPDLDRRAKYEVELLIKSPCRGGKADDQHPERADNRNNHAYWAGMAVWGRGLRRTAETFLTGVWPIPDRDEQMQDVGRCRSSGGRGVRCTSICSALAPLVMLAAMGEHKLSSIRNNRAGLSPGQSHHSRHSNPED